MHRTKYSVSASVNWTGSDDLKSGPRFLNSGMAANCSEREKKEVRVSLGPPSLRSAPLNLLYREGAAAFKSFLYSPPPKSWSSRLTLEDVVPGRSHFLGLADHQGDFWREETQTPVNASGQKQDDDDAWREKSESCPLV